MCCLPFNSIHILFSSHFIVFAWCHVWLGFQGKLCMYGHCASEETQTAWAGQLPLLPHSTHIPAISLMYVVFCMQSQILEQPHRTLPYSYSAAVRQHFSTFLHIREDLKAPKFLCENMRVHKRVFQCDFMLTKSIYFCKIWISFNLHDIPVALQAEPCIRRGKHWLHLIIFFLVLLPFSNAYTTIEMRTCNVSIHITAQEKGRHGTINTVNPSLRLPSDNNAKQSMQIATFSY